jgi:hypothetical protein
VRLSGKVAVITGGNSGIGFATAREFKASSTQWAYFLIGMKELLEGGEGRPYGGNLRPISRWSK